jgi:phenylpyruvate tautomerase
MLTLTVNTPLAAAEHEDALAELSAAIAKDLGKPERYVMVSIHPGTPLMYSGDTSPAAFGDLSSLGLSSSQTAGLSATLCGVIERRFGVPPDRTYIVFHNVERSFWGWNGGTF